MLLETFIQRRARELGRPYRGTQSALAEACSLPFLNGTSIHFTWFLDGPTRRPNAMSMWNGLILVNAEWAARLVLYDDDEVREAFAFTMGHEMTHQAGDYSFFDLRGNGLRFVNWVSEVHADFGGAALAFDGRLEPAVRAIDYKRAGKKKDADSLAHPSWLHRRKYVETGAFDAGLISRIASDCNCRNMVLIDKVNEFYQPIKLEGKGTSG